MVKRYREGYWAAKVYNTHYNCWDTEDGDDYERGLRDNDVWMRLPKVNI
jgi:hypothetical protein